MAPHSQPSQRFLMLLGSLCLFAPPTCHCGHQKLSSCQDLSAPRDRWDGNWPAETWLEIVCMLTVCTNPLFFLESPGTGFTPCKAGERVCDNGSTLVRIAHVSVHPFSLYVQGPTLSSCFQRQVSCLGHFALCLEPSRTAEGAVEKAHAAVWVPRRLRVH